MKKIIITSLVLIAVSIGAVADPIVTESTSTSRSTAETTVKSPPPTAVAPGINSMNNDLCAVGVSGAAQTQILGIAIGGTFRDKNCERLKLSKTLYDMGMKVAAVATLCQDERVFVAMMNAGTPCPVDGKIGDAAKLEWTKAIDTKDSNKEREETRKDIGAYGRITSNSFLEDFAGNDPAVRKRLGLPPKEPRNSEEQK